MNGDENFAPLMQDSFILRKIYNLVIFIKMY
jgi:hypothetical protein